MSPKPFLVSWVELAGDGSVGGLEEGVGGVGGGTHAGMPAPIWEVLPHFLPVQTGQCQRAPAGPGPAEWANAMWHVTRGI